MIWTTARETSCLSVMAPGAEEVSPLTVVSAAVSLDWLPPESPPQAVIVARTAPTISAIRRMIPPLRFLVYKS